MVATKGPRIEVVVRNSEMLGVMRKGTGLMMFKSPEKQFQVNIMISMMEIYWKQNE